MQGLDRSLENAAQDLFAAVAGLHAGHPAPDHARGGRRVPAAFVLSLDDFVITNFVGGSVNTFPTWVFGASRIGVPPQVNVWGTILFVGGLIAAGTNLVASFRTSRRAAALETPPRRGRNFVKVFTKSRGNAL